jgi:hypothetical protein
MPGASVPMAGFGSSDCDCRAHMFFFTRRPRFASLHKKGSPGERSSLRRQAQALRWRTQLGRERGRK